MTNPSLWNQILIWPILNLLIGFYKLFAVIHLPGALGWAIIGLTVVIRFLLLPLTNAQLKSSQKLQQLKPKLEELQKKHKNDKVKLQQAQLSLYQEAGVNPAAGCLPLLIQMPVFIALYQVFLFMLNGSSADNFVKQINQVLYIPLLHIDSFSLDFLGINLATKPNQWQKEGMWLLIVPVITGLLQYLQTRLMMPTTSKPKDGTEEDQTTLMQQQMGLIMPVMIGVFAFSFPLGLSLYWNSMTLFGIMQQMQVKSKLHE